MMLAIILVCVFVVAGILGYVDWQKVFEKRWGNDVRRARVYVEAGEQVVMVFGKMIYESGRGMLYRYKWGKKELVVAVPFDYPHKFVRGRRMIRVVVGEASARYWDNRQVSEDGVFSVSDLVRSHLVSELVKSMSGGGEINWKMWLMIAGGVLVAGIVVYQILIVPEVEPALKEPAIGILMGLGVL